MSQLASLKDCAADAALMLHALTVLHPQHCNGHLPRVKHPRPTNRMVVSAAAKHLCTALFVDAAQHVKVLSHGL